MKHNSYSQLTVREQKELIGNVFHLLTTNEQCFAHVIDMVDWAKTNGILDGVKILPEDWKDDKTETILDKQKLDQ